MFKQKLSMIATDMEKEKLEHLSGIEKIFVETCDFYKPCELVEYLQSRRDDEESCINIEKRTPVVSKFGTVQLGGQGNFTEQANTTKKSTATNISSNKFTPGVASPKGVGLKKQVDFTLP